MLRYGHRDSSTGTFRVDLGNGVYQVHVYMGDTADHVGVSLNANGTFDNPTERLGATGLGMAGSVTLAAGSTTIIFRIPASTPLTASTSYGRFRLSTAGGLSPTDLVDAADGEVERCRTSSG